MYSVGSLLPVEGIPDGSTYLVVGPPMTGKRGLVMNLLAAGLDEDAVAVVSTDSSSTDVRASLAEHAGLPVEDVPVGVVDCVGDSHGTEGLGPLDSRVSSPADLTGIGMELTTLLERLYGEHSPRLRFGLLSLTTMSMYASPEQVVRFLHVVTNRIREASAVGFVVAHADTMDEEHLQRLRSFVDGVVEVREADGAAELRVLGHPSGNTDWATFEEQRQVPAAPEPAAGHVADPTEPAATVADSLRTIYESVRADAPTLTVSNYSGPAEAFAVVERYFDRQGIEVREASMDVEHPQSVALLHRGDDLLASESVPALRGAIDIQSGTTGTFSERHTSDLLEALDRSVFGASAADKGLLIDVSHSIELLANRTGTGTLHAGFQYLSNLTDDEQAARIYERLAARNVETHVYGVADSSNTIPGAIVHESESPEVRESWFVVFDGGGDPARTAALLAYELDANNEYNGFWTYESDIVDRIDAYLTATYADSVATAD